MSCHSSSSSSSFPSFRFFSFSPVLVGSSTCRSAGGYTVHVRSVSCSAFPSRVTRNKNYSSNRDPISPIIPPPFSPSYFFARRLRYLFLYSVFLYFHNVHAPYFNDRALSSPPVIRIPTEDAKFQGRGISTPRFQNFFPLLLVYRHFFRCIRSCNTSVVSSRIGIASSFPRESNFSNFFSIE